MKIRAGRMPQALINGQLWSQFGLALALLAAIIPFPSSLAQSESDPRTRLLAAYPEFLKSIDGNTLTWADGTTSQIDDGKGVKPFEAWLDSPDIDDMFQIPYVPGDLKAPPAKGIDPGRARNEAFFQNMYGNCLKAETQKQLTDVVWLPKKSGQRLKFSKTNGAAAALDAVSKELDEFPAAFDKYLKPSEGTFNCRLIDGTKRVSAHGFGIAIDISTKHTNYWRWAKGGPNGPVEYKNQIPMEIVRVFENHGFIWGGKWYHYDTMHFEYRPELMPKAANK